MTNAMALTAACAAEALLLDLEAEFPETMPETKRNAKPKSTSSAAKDSAADEESLAGRTLDAAVNSWLEANPMDFKTFADTVGASTAAIYQAFKYIRHEPRKRGTANKVCAAIGIEPSGLFIGKIQKAKPRTEVPAHYGHRVLALAKRIASTKKAEQAAKMLEDLLASGEH